MKRGILCSNIHCNNGRLMKNKKTIYDRVNSLDRLAPYVLFLSSYLPLFILIAIKEGAKVETGAFLLKIDCVSVGDLVRAYFIPVICLLCIVFGLVGTFFTFKNIEGRVENGSITTIEEVSGLNEEPLAYIATYVISFVPQDSKSFGDMLALLFFLAIVCYLYIRSKLLLVNPVLSLRYSIFSIRFEDGEVLRQGVLISRDRYIQEKDCVKIYNIGYQLYYGYKKEK